MILNYSIKTRNVSYVFPRFTRQEVLNPSKNNPRKWFCLKSAGDTSDIPVFATMSRPQHVSEAHEKEQNEVYPQRNNAGIDKSAASMRIAVPK